MTPKEKAVFRDKMEVESFRDYLVDAGTLICDNTLSHQIGEGYELPAIPLVAYKKPDASRKNEDFLKRAIRAIFK